MGVSSRCIMCVQYLGGVQTVADIMSTVRGYLEYHGGVQYHGGYHDKCGGYLEYRGGYHEYCGGKIFCYLSTPRY